GGAINEERGHPNGLLLRAGLTGYRRTSVNCPKCGATNRANAKFCVQCSAPLAPDVQAVTMKICPQCGGQNRIGARFCAHCGHTFATPAVPATPRRIVYAAGVCITILGVMIIGALLAGGRQGKLTEGTMPLTPEAMLAAQTPLPSERLERALLATVQIIVPMDRQRRSSAGSGSILTEKGHILTNFHVLGDVKTGRLHNRRGVIYVAVSAPNLKDPPQVEYIAELMQADQALDLALIEIVAKEDGGDLPALLGLTTMPIGDSDTVKIGDELSIIGFPGLGGDTVTFTRGSVSGFLTDEGWIKTDAEINSGNSGGAAINREGQLVGIPSQVAAETFRHPGKIGLVRPVNLARPLIELALMDAQE
ncbi:MAG TPA: trypsin-like serine protease, partial [Anaerolineae bacterium]|nr:trypsin-like serine protease [Anaerolineae bacterium]